MSEGATQLEQRYIPDDGEKVRFLTLDQVDGRTRAAVRVRNTEKQFEADLGGELTEAQKALVRRAAVLSAVIEDQESRWAKGETIKLDEYLPAAKTLTRVLLALGLERKAKAVPPGNGLAPLLGHR